MAPAKRKKPRNVDDPRGQFARFLRAWYDRKKDAEPAYKQSDLADLLQVSERGLRFWLKGDAGPVFEDLDFVAEALLGEGKDWADLAAAVRKYCQTGSLK